MGKKDVQVRQMDLQDGKMHLQRFKMKMQTIKKFYGTVSHECDALARRAMKMLLLVNGRGLIYQALSQAIHPLGLMNQTPTSRPFALITAL
jgi:hypothetical protein